MLKAVAYRKEQTQKPPLLLTGRSRFREADRVPIALNPEDLNRVIRCPPCDLPMDVHPYYGPGNIVIDSCHRCHVVWLDHGELALVESAPGRR